MLSHHETRPFYRVFRKRPLIIGGTRIKTFVFTEKPLLLNFPYSHKHGIRRRRVVLTRGDAVSRDF